MIARRLPSVREDHALAGAIALFVGLAIWPWVAPPAPTVRPPAGPPERAAVSTLPALPPMNSFSAIVDRPLFSPSRRPAQNSPGPAGPAVESRYRLLGVLNVGARKKAFVADGTRRVEVFEGDMLDGWRVKEVGVNRVLLTSPTGEAAIKLKPAAAAEPTKPQ